jgi:PAS domain S-box-containing protein
MQKINSTRLQTFKRLFNPKSVSKTISQQSVNYLYTPIIAIMLFMLAMFAILWSLSEQESKQSETSFSRDIAFAAQRIQVNLDENEEEFLVLSKSLPVVILGKTGNEFYRSASQSLNKHPEILQIQSISSDFGQVMSYPNLYEDNETIDADAAEILKKGLQSTLKAALASGHGQYGSIMHLEHLSPRDVTKDRAVVFWYVQPSDRFTEQTHTIAVLYSLPLIVKKIIPADILSKHRFSVIDAANNNLYTLNDRNLSKTHTTHQIRLTKLPDNLVLQAESYPLPSNLTYQMLIWLVIGLCSYVIWSFWSIWRQMRYRQDIQRNLIKETTFRRAIEDSMPIGLRVHDPDGRITYVNPAFCKMVGWSAEELIGLKPPFPFWTDDEESINTKKLSAIFQTGVSVSRGIEATITSRLGQKIAVRNFVSPLVDQKNKQTGWIATLVDISEPKRIREELAIAQERFITVLEGLSTGICVVNPKTSELLFTNNLYREMFANLPNAHQLLLGSEAVTEDDMQLDLDIVDGFAGLPSAALTPILGDSHEMQLVEQGNWFEVSRRFIPWTDGHLAKLLITSDITEKRMARENLRVEEERLQFSSRLTTMGEMASSIAHELNQPLAAINNYCMGVMNRLRAKQDPQINTEIIPALEKISTQSLRAGTIIQGIRSFVKRSSPQRQSYSLEKIILQSVELAEIEANRHGISIKKTIHPNLPDCFVDPILIEQVIINLLKNAIDSMRMTYPRSRRGKLAPIEIIADLENDIQQPMLRIRVVDTGSGIDEKHLKQIYEPFFSTKDEGMGMGLNICRSIIESHEGRLWGENNAQNQKIASDIDTLTGSPALGCTFTILLPLEHYLAHNVDSLQTSESSP